MTVQQLIFHIAKCVTENIRIIFSRPVKAAADGVILKANRTYTAYDVTDDGTKDKIRIRAANQTDDETYTSLTVSVNGKTAYRLKNTRFYNVIANIYTLKNGQPFLYLYAPADNGDGPVCALLKYTNGKFRKALDFTEIMAGYEDLSPHGGLFMRTFVKYISPGEACYNL